MPKVTISYHDDEALHAEEIIASAKALYGTAASVKVSPDSNTDYAQLYFALQTATTREQADLFFDEPELYKLKMRELEQRILNEVRSVLSDVIADNEEKLAG
jgi:hypothetical protein